MSRPSARVTTRLAVSTDKPKCSAISAGRPLEIDAGNDELTIPWTKRRQRVAVPLIRLGSYGRLERRCLAGTQIVGQFDGLGTSADSSDCVANRIDHRQPQVGLHGPDMSHFEGVQPSEHMECRFLYQVAGIHEASHGVRQPPMRPSPQFRQAALQDGLDSLAIAFTGPDYELEGGFVA